MMRYVCPRRGATNDSSVRCVWLGWTQDMTKEWVSLDWLLTRYKSRGVTFTNVLAFEFMAVNHQDWWDGVPADMFSTITFYNVGVSAEPDSKYNPWNLLRALAEPDDFVVIKLDIDTPAIENTLIDQLLADKQVRLRATTA